MRLVTGQQMQQLDRRAAEEYGIPGLVLMENAGRQVAEAACRVLGAGSGRLIYIACGGGNNGGDGLVAARHLANRRARVKVLLAASPSAFRGDAAVNLEVARRSGLELVEVTEENLPRLELGLATADLVVDALVGTGVRGPLRGLAAQLVRAINNSGRPVLAADIPSGVEADTGWVAGEAVRARWTVTFGLPKLGLIQLPGAAFAGELSVADIGFPRQMLEDPSLGEAELLSPEAVAALLPGRPMDAHKGRFGHVLVVAGSRGMTGAGALACRAALRVGAGLVTWALPASLQAQQAAAFPEALTAALPESEPGSGRLAGTSAGEVRLLMEGRDVLLIGPGLSTVPPVPAMVRQLLAAYGGPAVVDADALNGMASAGSAMASDRPPAPSADAPSPLGPAPGGLPRPWVITPHPGEAARLLGTSVEQVQRDRLGAARRLAESWGAVAVLKGARTVICEPQGRVWVSPVATAALAVGGSGDVLAGAIAGLMAQGLAPAEAAVTGVYLHGLAGLLAAGQQGAAGALAGEVADRLPEAARRLRQQAPLPSGARGLVSVP